MNLFEGNALLALIDRLRGAFIGRDEALMLRNSYGTAFPASPALGDLFYRTDLGLACRWNGTYWHAVNPHWVGPDELPDTISVWPFGVRATGKVYDIGLRARDLDETGTLTYTAMTRGAYATGWSTSNYLGSSSVNFGNFTTATAMCWYRITGSLASNQSLMSNDSNGTRGWRLDHNGSAGLAFVGSAGQLNTTTMTDALDTWYLGGFTYSSGSVKLFRFATHAMVSETGTRAIGTLANSFKVGRSDFAGYEYPVTGRIAQPRFYGAVLADAQIEYVALCEIALVVA